MTKEEKENLAHNNYPYGSEMPIGSRDRSLYEKKKESFLNGLNAAINYNNKIMNKEQKIDEAMSWWYDISDHQTTELIMKHKLRKPIKEQDIVKLFALYDVSKTK
jgi:hypothetical protein